MSGPVIFDVIVVGIPYVEQITILDITGASATNTITFNGNSNTIEFDNSSSSSKHVIKLDGAKYIIINNLNILAKNQIYGWGIHFINNASNNQINDSTITIISASAVSSFSSGIVASGLTTSYSNTTFNNNILNGNTIDGGFHGIIITGSAGTILNNTIQNNTIKDFYNRGISLTFSTNCTISNNNISRPNRVVITDFVGIHILNATNGLVIDRNNIHNTHDNASNKTTLSYGIQLLNADGLINNKNKITNNLIYEVNNTGIIYGIFNTSSDHCDIIHNTISLDKSGTIATEVTYGFYQTSLATGIVFKNNIIDITRGGTTANKVAIYFATSTSSITSDYNDLYIIPSDSTKSYTGYISSLRNTLTDWQTASNGDLNSVSVNPIYVSPSSNLKPTNPLMDNKGTPTYVDKDHDLVTRSTFAPDVGAYEFGTSPLPPVEAPCFLADALVSTPYGERPIGSLKVGDLISTVNNGDRPIISIAINRVKSDFQTCPYIIPVGLFGCTKELLISPFHRVLMDNGWLIVAHELNLQRSDISGEIVYYNLQLPNWSEDRMIVNGVKVESWEVN